MTTKIDTLSKLNVKLSEELDAAYTRIEELEEENDRLKSKLFNRKKKRESNPYKYRKRLKREESFDAIKDYLKDVGESTSHEICADLGWSSAKFKRLLSKYPGQVLSRRDPRYTNRFLYRLFEQEPDRSFDTVLAPGTPTHKLYQYLKHKGHGVDMATLCNALNYSQTRMLRLIADLGDRIVKTKLRSDQRVTLYNLDD